VKNNGYILLHRKLRDNWVWPDEKFTKTEAWIDILMETHFLPNQMPFNGGFKDVKRGEFVTSKLKLSKRWDWSRKKVSNFLDTLEDAGMVTTESTPNCTTIKVLNYDQYQRNENEKEQQKEQQNAQQKVQQKIQRGNNSSTQLNNNKQLVNNNNQDKTITFADFDKMDSSHIFNKKEIETLKLYEDEKLNDLFNDYLILRISIKATNSKRAIKTLYNKLNDITDLQKEEVLNEAIVRSWKSVFTDKYVDAKPTQTKKEPTAGGAEWMGI
jgi:hypothetical protein